MLGSQQGCTALFFLHGTNIYHCEKQGRNIDNKKHLCLLDAGVFYGLIALYVSLAEKAPAIFFK